MNLKDIFWLSYKDLREKKVRTALTIIMVMIGVASIIALSSQTEGISQSIQSSLDALGPTTIIVTPTGPAGFTVADISRLETLPNVSSVTPILTGTVSVLANGQNTSATLIGVSSQDLQTLLGSVNLYQGSVYQDTVTPEADIGYSIAFPSTLAGRQNIIVGQPITIKFSGRNGATIAVPVQGILQQYGSSVLISVDSGVMVSMEAAQVLLHRSSFNLMLIKATNTSSVNALSSLITTVYGSNARVITTQQLIQTAASIIGAITVLLLIIAGISLVVAAIGIMNIMLIAVYERTHEIGIFKALGFKNRHILTIFLFQAVIIGFVGGVVGILLGAGASYSLSFLISHSTASSTNSTPSAAPSFSNAGGFRSGGGVFVNGGGRGPAVEGGGGGSLSSASSLSYQPVFTLITILEAMFVAIVVAVLAGLYPAYRASKMEPIQALRQL